MSKDKDAARDPRVGPGHKQRSTGQAPRFRPSKIATPSAEALVLELHENIQKTCQAVRAPGGDRLMELMSLVYKGRHDAKQLQEEVGLDAIEDASSFGLLERSQNHVRLTPQGYLVGNVAKEYVHWIGHGRKMPPPYPPDDLLAGKDVLDLGCSFGRWLWHFQKKARTAIGLEKQKEYIALGRVLAEREGIPCPQIIPGSAEALSDHVPDNSVDVVFTRLVLNHIFVIKTLKQVNKVLRPGGILWIQAYTWEDAFDQYRQAGKDGHLRGKIFGAFGIANSVVFELTRRQLSIRSQGRMHSVHKPVFPTRRTWRAVCRKLGFEDHHVIARDTFRVRKPQTTAAGST